MKTEDGLIVAALGILNPSSDAVREYLVVVERPDGAADLIRARALPRVDAVLIRTFEGFSSHTNRTNAVAAMLDHAGYGFARTDDD